VLSKTARRCKRPFLLLEVMIAFALIVLCALPLIAPYLEIVKEQKQFNVKMELDHASHLFYVMLLEQLHNNKIDWKDIHSSAILPLTADHWKAIGYSSPLPFVGSYHFKEIKNKSDKKKAWNGYLFRLTLAFVDKRVQENPPKINFPYTVCLVRHVNQEASDASTDKK
jgi:hypothetical protein